MTKRFEFYVRLSGINTIFHFSITEESVQLYYNPEAVWRHSAVDSGLNYEVSPVPVVIEFRRCTYDL